MTVKATPSITIADYIRSPMESMSSAERREAVTRLLPALARLIRLLHDRSLSHRDLKAANILIEGDPQATELRLSLIDLVGVDMNFPLAEERRIQNLARLYLSMEVTPGRTRTDALRFLRLYLPWCRTSRTTWKSLWRTVDRAAEAKRTQNERRGRVLS